MTRLLALALGLILPLMAVDFAMAQTDGGRQATVSLKDLDLNSREGQATVLRRLDAAVAKVCGGAPDSRELARGGAYDDCRAQARADALVRLNNAQVSAAVSAPEAATAPARPKT